MSVAIADARHLWMEVDKLKAQYTELRNAERFTQNAQVKLEEYVGSFVTHAQLEAAMSTRIAQSAVNAALDKLHLEFQLALDQKSDIEMVRQIQAKKLDISVFDTSFWDFKKFRHALEQKTQDLYANFALQMENKINSKISMEDFNRIFHFDDGTSSSLSTTITTQKTSLEMAAEQISKMKDQLQTIQEYVQSDQERQLKMADLNVSVLDLTRKQHASRNQITQLTTSIEKLQQTTLKNQELQKSNHLEEQITKKVQQEIQHFKNYTFDQVSKKIFTEIDKNKKMSNEIVKSLEQIQQFTERTLTKGIDNKLQQQMTQIQDLFKEEIKQTHKTKETTTTQVTKMEEQMIRMTNYITQIEENINLLKENVHQTKEELAYVKGPLVTLTTNLKEENVAILQEIKRSQNESREILLDYKEKISTTPNTSFRGGLPGNMMTPVNLINGGRRMSRNNQLTPSNVSNMSSFSPLRPASNMSMYYNQQGPSRPVSSSSSSATSNNDNCSLHYRPPSSASVSETGTPTGSPTNKPIYRAQIVTSTSKPMEFHHSSAVVSHRSSSPNGGVVLPVDPKASMHSKAITPMSTPPASTRSMLAATSANEEMDFNFGTISQEPIENAFLLDDKESKTQFTRGGTLSFSFFQKRPEEDHLPKEQVFLSQEQEDESELFGMDEIKEIEDDEEIKREVVRPSVMIGATTTTTIAKPLSTVTLPHLSSSHHR